MNVLDEKYGLVLCVKFSVPNSIDYAKKPFLAITCKLYCLRILVYQGSKRCSMNIDGDKLINGFKIQERGAQDVGVLILYGYFLNLFACFFFSSYTWFMMNFAVPRLIKDIVLKCHVECESEYKS